MEPSLPKASLPEKEIWRRYTSAIGMVTVTKTQLSQLRWKNWLTRTMKRSNLSLHDSKKRSTRSKRYPLCAKWACADHADKYAIETKENQRSSVRKYSADLILKLDNKQQCSKWPSSSSRSQSKVLKILFLLLFYANLLYFLFYVWSSPSSLDPTSAQASLHSRSMAGTAYSWFLAPS